MLIEGEGIATLAVRAHFGPTAPPSGWVLYLLPQVTSLAKQIHDPRRPDRLACEAGGEELGKLWDGIDDGWLLLLKLGRMLGGFAP